MAFKNIIGLKFNKLTVIEQDESIIVCKKPVIRWKCRCDCGNTITVPGSSLKTSHTKSCGCIKLKHGYAHKERLYDIWLNMKRRCYNSKNKRFKHYGKKGIIICKDWKNNYLSFRSWSLVNGYSDNLTIDRIDNNGNYEPNNCKWSNSIEQQNNTSRNRMLTYNDEILTMAQFARKFNFTYSKVNKRIQMGWSIKKIIEDLS